MSNRYGFYGFFGCIALVMLATKLLGCASPARAEVESTTAAPETTTIIENELTWSQVREDGVLVVHVETTDEVAPDAASAPIVALEDSDALLDAGLQVGDEVLRVSDGFDTVTVRSAGTLDDAFTRIAAAVDDDDSYLDVLVRRDGRNLMITVAAMPST